MKPHEERIDAFIEDLLNPLENVDEGTKNIEPCFECGHPTVVRHHVVPRLYGGTKTIPLCPKHHCLAHSIKLSHNQMIKAGIIRARAAGKKIGRPSTIEEKVKKEILRLRGLKYTLRGIATRLDVSLGTVQRVTTAQKDSE